jgi:hypothetical protein
VWRGLLLIVALVVSGCTSQFTLGPGATWAANNAPVIPGYHALQLAGGGFIEEPDVPAAPAPTAEQTVLGALQEAQATREAVRKLAR